MGTLGVIISSEGTDKFLLFWGRAELDSTM